MSSRIRIPKKRKAELSDSSPTTRPQYFPALPAYHGSNRRRSRPVVFLSDGSTFAQTPFIQIPEGQRGFRQAAAEDAHTEEDTEPNDTQDGLEASPDEPDSLGVQQDSGWGDIHFTHHTPPPLSPHRRKRQRQSQRWLVDVLPKLLHPYMDLVEKTHNFQVVSPQISHVCTCAKPSRVLNMIIVRFASLQKTSIVVCACRTAPTRLLEMGCFPCAPIHPTLAVDIQVLEFVGKLFLRMPPNHTAWCNALEDFLASQGYRLHGEDPIRRRFANCLQWYNALKDKTRVFVDSILSETRSTHNIPPRPRVDSARVASEASSSPLSSPTPTIIPLSRLEEDINVENPSPPRLDRPSDYLRARCPLCFGGSRRQVGFDAIVCVDACFTQKHNKQQRDHPIHHPQSVFVPEADVLSMEAEVELLRPPRPKKASSMAVPLSEVKDGFEGSMKVPSSVLDGCQDSFTAADDRRQKASTKFFDCTALMGLLCRHDRVLWLVNMTSAGEKQHYVLCLLNTLFQHLPDDFTIGLLYDIACQLHRSCIKFNFLSQYSHRLSFAISVFHAFGHRWPCQVIYHPRKREGYGLSDGEGCERFWHSISKLIPFLRVCGYYVRIYTVDVQIQHLDHENLLGLGKWLERKWIACHDRRRHAMSILNSCGKSEAFLRSQWAAQIAYQTKPLPSQSQGSAKRAIHEVLQLREVVARLQSSLSKLEDSLVESDLPPYSYLEVHAEIPVKEQRLKEAQRKLRAKEMALGVRERQEVARLVNSPFVKARVNALAVKTRLMERLRQRKFERDCLERSFRKQKTTNEHKADRHLEDAVSKRDPTIQRLAKQYNDLVATMQSLIRGGRAPRHAVAPVPIDMKSLFSLDVDDAIWDDVGLDDECDNSDPPPWLSEEAVRSGIRALLERDRCDEEILRLRHERNAMQEWFVEEWVIVTQAIATTGHLGIRHQLQLTQDWLMLLLHEWERHTALLRPSIDAPDWGPTKEEIAEFRQLRRGDVVDSFSDSISASDSDSDEDMVDPDPDSALIDLLDHIDLVEDDWIE